MWIEQAIDRHSQQKLYVQVYSIIKDKIEKSEWPSGTQIPTEDDLCRLYDVSKATIRIALSELARDGYLTRQQGKGSFVAFSMPHFGMHMKTSLTEDMFGKEVNARKEILVKGVKQPSEDIKAYLKIEDFIYYVLCKRIVDGNPAFLEESFFPLFNFPGIENEDVSQSSFYKLAEEKSIRKIAKVLQTIESGEIKGDAADILKVKDGSPAILLHRLLIGAQGNPIAYTRLIGGGSAYKIQTEFERIR
ncbi:MAG: GntR family transcriptional regulator [Nitrospiraceae bacterium]|jgi:DNA-binding GntR family transcriptional regulator|nr:MAG: GntR family transcriptional regulator [Nitrospiraceae bacterium]